jgi:hypothetical protein
MVLKGVKGIALVYEGSWLVKQYNIEEFVTALLDQPN